MAPTPGIWSEPIWPSGWAVTHVEETGSTNADLLAALEAGTAADRDVLVADYQSSGRGRLDRRWEAPVGANLLVSIVSSPVPEVPAEVTQRVGLAAVAAVARLLPNANTGLKWPNDILLDDRKLGGILAQRSFDANAVVIGLGLNVGWAPEGAASLGGAKHPAEVLALLLEEFDALPDDISGLYRERLLTLGKSVRVELPGDNEDAVTGIAEGVDNRGRLLVSDEQGVTHKFDVGDIVHLRAAGPPTGNGDR